MIHKISHILFALTLAISVSANTYMVGPWQLDVTDTNGQVSLYKDNIQLLKNSCAVVRINNTDYNLSDQTTCNIHESDISNAFGSGKQITIVYTIADTTITQTYNLYPNLDYIITQVSIEAPVVIRSNHIAPIVSNTPVMPLPTGDLRDLFVPFDNDGWVSYNSYTFGNNVVSNEVGLLYNATTYDGYVLGSIEHTDWKTGVTTNTSSNGNVTSIIVYCGHSNEWTHDVLPHGALRGKKISSAQILVGRFSDWRTAMETYGDANAIVAPKAKWDKGKPFIWNSWGVLMKECNYAKAAQNAIFIADSLVTRGYHNDGTVYVDLDSWHNLSLAQENTFTTSICAPRGLKTGLYWCPWSDWGKDGDAQVPGAPEYTFKDIWLYADGKPIERTEGAYSCDPTHPGTKKRAEAEFQKLHANGYEFVKIDFMTHGIYEADSWYDTTITTGIQAYNYGMRYLDSLADGIYLNLSIASLFPANYTQGRRIACDAWGSLGDAKYVLNSTTFGWWLDHVYSYNDGDELVFKDQTEAVNRIRLISGLITGIPCLGDDFSNYGDDIAKKRAKKLLNNPELMQMARETKAFRPLGATSGTDCATMYYTKVADTAFVALFNFTTVRTTYSFAMTDVEMLAGTTYTVKELMDKKTYTFSDSVSLNMRQNALVLKIYPYDPADVEEIAQQENDDTQKFIRNNQLYIRRNNQLFNALGQPIDRIQ